MYPIEKYDSWTLYRCETGMLPSKPGSAISPRQYLEYAQEDLRHTESPRTLINALGHAKRAIHMQADIILAALQSKHLMAASFPKKIDALSECGVVAPNVLRRLNRLRNTVEHEYSIPSRQEVEDAADIGQLFVEAADYLLRLFPVRIVLETNVGGEEAKLWLSFSAEEGALRICQCGPPPAGDVDWTVLSTDPEFALWLRRIIDCSRQGRVSGRGDR